MYDKLVNLFNKLDNIYYERGNQTMTKGNISMLMGIPLIITLGNSALYAKEAVALDKKKANIIITNKETRKKELKSLLLELLTEDNKKTESKKETPQRILVFQNKTNTQKLNDSKISSGTEETNIRQKISINNNVNYPFKDIIEKYSIEKKIDPLLVRAIIRQESNNNIKATSPKKAKGLMQLMDGTAKRFNVKDSYDPDENIRGGVSYLRLLLNEFKLEHALAGYNAGEGAVRTWGGIPPYKETEDYVKKVMVYYWQYKVEQNPSIQLSHTDKPKQTYNKVSTNNQRLKSKLMVYSAKEVER